MAQRKLWTPPAARARFRKRNLRIKTRIFLDRSTELLDCPPTSLDAATKIMDFLHASMPKTKVLNQVTESLDSATEEMNGTTGEPDQGAKIMDASAKELEPTAENLDIDV